MPNKPGYKTTEFWLTVISATVVWLDAVPLPEKFEGVVLAGLAAVYSLARGLAKISPSVDWTDDRFTQLTPLEDSPDAKNV